MICPVDQLGPFNHASKAWELLLPVLHAAQITDLRRFGVAKILARHQHRDSGWIRHHRVGRGALGELVDWHRFNFTGDQALVGLAWRHIRVGQALEGSVQQVARTVLA